MNLVELDVIFSSSSDEESDEELIELLPALNNERSDRKIPRVTNYAENLVWRYSGEEFRQTFRLKPEQFEYLLRIIAPDLQGAINFGNLPVTPAKQLLICLYYFATPIPYRIIADMFGVGKSTAWRCVFRCVVAIYAYRNFFIRWPTLIEAQQSFNAIYRRNRLPKVLGAVDGTHVRIRAPKMHRRAFYNRKKYASIHLQVVCNYKLEIIHAFSGFPGSVHDMRAFKYSGLQHMCNNEFFYENSHLLGDTAYVVQENVLAPYIDNGHLTPQETYFNTVLSKNRVMAECTIGVLKMRWRRLLDMCDMRHVHLIPYYIITCCILHNICVKKNMREHPIIPENNPQNLGPMAPTPILQRLGEQKRIRITQQVYNDL